jgi:formylglycine-generating enzyme required for sulfatase activity
VSDLSPLARLTKLQQLDVSSTPVSNVAPLSGLTQLKELNLSRTEVRDLSPLEGLTSLRTLALDGLGSITFNASRIPDVKILRDPPPRKAGAVYKPGETFRDCPQCPQMVVVPAGSFEMGSPPGEMGHQKDEEPQHTVRIAQPFAVSKYEVRFDEWMPCVQAAVCKALPDEGWGRGPRPVINVSWDDAKRYVLWLSRKAVHPYRLLTEAEWEYATRAGWERLRHWGDVEKDTCAYANVYDESFGCNDGYPFTAPVGMFQPNAFGVHDILGNVWEWTGDCYQDSYRGTLPDGTARVTGDCQARVIRGGGWDIDPQVVRSAFRSRGAPDFRYSILGFRVARTLTP